MNNTDIPPDALQLHLDKLFTVSIWQDDDLIETKKQLNLTKDKMDDIPLQYVTLPNFSCLYQIMQCACAQCSQHPMVFHGVAAFQDEGCVLDMYEARLGPFAIQ